MSLESERGRILPPDLDDRAWQDLVDEMRALIPRYAPSWTDHNPGDIGVALIELFAWLAESVIYRLNRVPEKNYLAFLNLLGTTRNPPTPASVYLTFRGSKDGRVPSGTQAATPASETEPLVRFETDEELVLSAANLDMGVLASEADGTYRQVPVVGPPAERFPIAIAAESTAQLCLGFDSSTHPDPNLRVRLYRPALGTDSVKVSWHYSPKGSHGVAPGPFAWPPLEGAQVVDATKGLRGNGRVTIRPPTTEWTAHRPSDGPQRPGATLGTVPVWTSMTPEGPPVTDGHFWIGVRLKNDSDAPIEIGIDRILHNAVLAHTALTVPPFEEVGTSTGRPFQTFALAQRPLFRAPDLRAPYGHLLVRVRAKATSTPEVWSLVDDFPHGRGNVYRLDPVTGEIRFGDSDRGSIPPAGAVIEATYRHVSAGAAGNVSAGRVNVLGTGTLPGTSVTNFGSGFGGADEESIDDALRRAPDELRIRDRAVTADDIEFLAGEVSTEVAVVRCLPPQLVDPPDKGMLFTPWQYAKINRSPGVINVIIVPDLGRHILRPEPTADLIDTVQSHLDQRRDVTARLIVRGPVYLPVSVKARIEIWRSASAAGVTEEAVEDEARQRIAAFLHPIHGGPSGRGWQVGEHVFSSDVFRAIAPSDDVGFVSELQVKGSTEERRPFPLPDFGPSVRLTDYELVCFGDADGVDARVET